MMYAFINTKFGKNIVRNQWEYLVTLKLKKMNASANKKMIANQRKNILEVSCIGVAIHFVNPMRKYFGEEFLLSQPR